LLLLRRTDLSIHPAMAERRLGAQLVAMGNKLIVLALVIGKQ
jgi:hypothetical protein